MTGGAGYIGSITTKVLKEKGFEPIIFDSLVTGHKNSLDKEKFYQGDLVKDINFWIKFLKKKNQRVLFILPL